MAPIALHHTRSTVYIVEEKRKRKKKKLNSAYLLPPAALFEKLLQNPLRRLGVPGSITTRLNPTNHVVDNNSTTNLSFLRRRPNTFLHEKIRRNGVSCSHHMTNNFPSFFLPPSPPFSPLLKVRGAALGDGG